MHLTGAYRSLPRPSSPLSAKAFTIRPCFALKIFKVGITTTPPEVTPHVLKTHFKVLQKRFAFFSFFCSYSNIRTRTEGAPPILLLFYYFF
jgi:hypothetical protein